MKPAYFFRFTFFLIFFSASANAAHVMGGKPAVAYSEDPFCPNGHHNSFFDLTYFNSEIPLGSSVVLHYHFEHDNYCNCPGVGRWEGNHAVVMKQWEQYGWYSRVVRETACGLNQTTLTGIVFKVEVVPPSTDLSLESTVSRGYYRAAVPNILSCAKLQSHNPKSCLVDLQWVNVP